MEINVLRRAKTSKINEKVHSTITEERREATGHWIPSPHYQRLLRIWRRNNDKVLGAVLDSLPLTCTAISLKKVQHHLGSDHEIPPKIQTTLCAGRRRIQWCLKGPKCSSSINLTFFRRSWYQVFRDSVISLLLASQWITIRRRQPLYGWIMLWYLSHLSLVSKQGRTMVPLKLKELEW